MTIIDFLKQTEIFKGLNDDQLLTIENCCIEEKLPLGKAIFREGDDMSYLYIVINGQIDLRFDLPDKPTSEKNTVASITKGKASGWSCLVPPYKAKLSSFAVMDTDLVKIDKKCLLSLFEKDPQAGFIVMSNIARVIADRFENLQDKIAKRKGYDIMFSW